MNWEGIIEIVRRAEGLFVAKSFPSSQDHPQLRYPLFRICIQGHRDFRTMLTSFFRVMGSDIFGSVARFFELNLSVQLGSVHDHPTEIVLN